MRNVNQTLATALTFLIQNLDEKTVALLNERGAISDKDKLRDLQRSLKENIMPFMIKDDTSRKCIGGYIQSDSDTLTISLSNANNTQNRDDDKTLILLEQCDNTLQVSLFGDINEDDATDVINLNDARTADIITHSKSDAIELAATSLVYSTDKTKAFRVDVINQYLTLRDLTLIGLDYQQEPAVLVDNAWQLRGIPFSNSELKGALKMAMHNSATTDQIAQVLNAMRSQTFKDSDETVLEYTYK
jgi:hypothetical protein